MGSHSLTVSSLKATDGPSGLPLTTGVRCHVRTTASETEALELPVREFGIICLVACEHLTSVTNILKHYWRHVCLTSPRRFVAFIYRRLRNILTYLLIYLPATRHKRTRPALTPAKQVGARSIYPRFTYPGGMEGWVDLIGGWLRAKMSRRSPIQLVTGPDVD